MIDDPILAIKRQLANAILAIAAGTNMHVAARRFGIGVARMSDLRRGRVQRFSVERLIRILATVDRPVELTVAPSSAPIIWFPQLRARRNFGNRPVVTVAQRARERDRGPDAGEPDAVAAPALEDRGAEAARCDHERRVLR